MATPPPFTRFNYPVSYRLGCGRIGELGATCKELGMTRPLVVTDPGVRRLPWFPRVQSNLEQAGLVTTIHSEVHENPIEADVDSGVNLYRSSSCDGVVLIGGGSPLDVGKCIALLAQNPGVVMDYEDIGDNYLRADPSKIPPMIAVPTTSGTGSEVGRASVIVSQSHEKKIIFHPKMQPPVVIADPELTFALPPHLTAYTGLDAFIHCFEAYCAPGYHPFADGIALEGMRLIQSALPRAYRDGTDALARTDMMVASSMGATAFQKGLGIVHAIAHALGGSIGIHHGLANAILLPYCMIFNRDVIGEKSARLARFLELERADFEGLLDWVIETRATLGVPHRLGGIPGWSAMLPEKLAPVALSDPSLSTNPKPATRADLQALMERAAHGALQ
jgi:alcohol dehydrogenase class IV